MRNFEQKGISALLLTVILSLIMVIFIVGLTVISTRELRQSSQLDQSARALYGAEAGVQDAVNSINNAISNNASLPTTPEPCENPTPDKQRTISKESLNIDDQYQSSELIGWVCRSITYQGSQVEGTLLRDESVQFNLTYDKMPGNNGPVTAVEIEYSSGQITGLNGPLNDCFYPASPANLGTNSQCKEASGGYNPWTAPAAMELGLTWWKGWDSSITIYNDPNDIIGLPIRNILVMPTKADQPQSNNSGNAADGMSSKCDSASAIDYHCRLEYKNNRRIPLKELSGTGTGIDPQTNPQNFILRLRPRYTNTNYRITFFRGNDKIDVKFPFAVIDVTGRSGDTYRRIKAYKPLTPSNIYNNLDNVLVSGTEICKNLIIDINHNGVGPSTPGGMNFCNGRFY
jgi:Tfp pilus assembly protein PilX